MSDTHGATGKGWIGVDLDGTLAFYDGWVGPAHIGAPVTTMLKRVRQWIEQGIEVRIVTARVSPGKEDSQECRTAIEKWVAKHIGSELEITHEKDHLMQELWDDRCVQVVPNTGARADLAAPMRIDACLLAVETAKSSMRSGDIEALSHAINEIEVHLHFMKGDEE